MRSARASASRRRPKGAGRSMRLKGVSYDVGRVLGMNWRPVFDPDVAHRKLAVINADQRPQRLWKR